MFITFSVKLTPVIGSNNTSIAKGHWYILQLLEWILRTSSDMSNMRKCLITFLYMPKIGLETQGIDMCLNGYIKVFENVIQNTSWK